MIRAHKFFNLHKSLNCRNNFIFFVRKFSDDIKNNIKEPTFQLPTKKNDALKLDNNVDKPVIKQYDLLYEGNAQVVIRLLLAATGINFTYWSYYVITSLVNQGVVRHGIEMGGDPLWGIIGGIGTGLMLYSTRTYANHSIYKAYETLDKERLGIQLYNMFGNPGRKVEFSHRSIRKVDIKGGNYFGSSTYPVRVTGMNYNILIDTTGKFYENKKLLDIAENNYLAYKNNKFDSRLNSSDNPYTINDIDKKSDRIQWKRQHSGKKKEKLK